MIVSEEQRVLFVHVQKTGGLTVEALLLQHLPDAERVRGLRGDRHVTLPTALRARPELTDLFVFGFVRNPWARMLSWHQMIVRRHQRGRGDELPFWRDVAASCPDFESFVLRGPDEFSRLARPQLDYLRTADRRADFIGRTETLAADLGSIAARIGLPALETVPRNNRNRHSAPYQESYTPAMRDRVGELFAVDLEAFGYTFEA